MRGTFWRLAVALLVVGLFAPVSASSAYTTSTTVAKATSFSVTAADKSLIVRWAAAISSNKAKVTGYLVTATATGYRTVKTLSASARTIKITGLTNGKTYRVSLQSISGTKVSSALAKSIAPKKGLLSNSILFRQPSDMFLGAPDQELYAIAAGAPVQFSTSTPTICTVTNGIVKTLKVGDCVITASSPANSTYAAATPVQVLLTIATPPTPMNKTLLWFDEFSGAADTAPSSTYWTADTTDGCPAPYSNCGWGNNERQYYVSSANKTDGSLAGLLNISAARQTNSTNYSCYYGRCEWLSGKITTYNKVNFTYGYMEARIKLPAGNGSWPAFWMLGSNIATVPWPRSGEIDIMEYKGSAPTITYGTVHFANSGGGHAMLGATKDSMIDLSQDFHRYGMLWKPTEIVFYLDDNVVYTARKSESGLTYWPFGPNAAGADPSFYLIFNLAMGGNFGGAVDSGLNSANMSVDWVRYYSVDGLGKVTLK